LWRNVWMNSNKHCETRDKLCKVVKRKSPGFLISGVRLLHDGARSHSLA
jgi:hypothetical protein